ncbi:hypothetical protein AB0D74_41100 [Streptomyces sp. NPDC048278]|uniref:hypothetical protein n=1 Tax=Streptomyces sp. NPDC048278 TaxID=3155809 RepID=UPI003440AA57
MDRLKKAAADHREAAAVVRSRGNEAKAKRMEDRADELESGRVTDATDQLSALTRWAFRR